jgi:hypothetical protein
VEIIARRFIGGDQDLIDIALDLRLHEVV